MVAASALLGLSGMHHLGQWKQLLSSLLKHRLIRYSIARMLARLAPLQILLAVAMMGAVSLGTDRRELTMSVGIVAAALFGAMAAYLTIVLMRNPAATCACFGREQPLNWLSVARAFSLACCSLGFAAVGVSSPLQPIDIVLGLVFASLLIVMPGISSNRSFRWIQRSR